MESIRSAILRHVRLRVSTGERFYTYRGNMLKQFRHQLCTSVGASNDQIMERVIELVKKYDKTDASKVNRLLLFLSLFAYLGFHSSWSRFVMSTSYT